MEELRRGEERQREEEAAQRRADGGRKNVIRKRAPSDSLRNIHPSPHTNPFEM